MKHIKRFILSLLLILSLSSAFKENILFTDNVICVNAKEKVKLNKKKVTIKIGNSTKLKLKGTSSKIKWSSSNKKVATVSKKGVVKAVKNGTATITAKVNKKKYSCKIHVPKPQISSTEESIYIGKTTQLSIKNIGKTPKWTSSNPRIATVNSRGIVTGLSNGITIITAKINNTVSLKCTVTVKEYTTVYVNTDINTDYQYDYYEYVPVWENDVLTRQERRISSYNVLNYSYEIINNNNGSFNIIFKWKIKRAYGSNPFYTYVSLDNSDQITLNGVASPVSNLKVGEECELSHTFTVTPGEYTIRMASYLKS